MDTFTIKKLAEVQAFVDLGGVIVQRAGPSFAGQAAEVAQKLSALKLDSKTIIKEPTELEIFEPKRDKTVTKLTAMMEMYIGDEWDNPVEVLEWLSFYSGSAAAHAALVSETLGGTPKQQLQTLSEDFLIILTSVISAMRAAGKSH